MRHTFSRSPLMRLAAIWAVTLALAVKILVAPGMMPVADAGGIRITLCTGSGPVETSIDLDGERHGDQGKTAQEACPFGVLAGGVSVMEGSLLAAPAFVLARVAPIRPPLPARAPPVADPPPATGPPSFV